MTQGHFHGQGLKTGRRRWLRSGRRAPPMRLLVRVALTTGMTEKPFSAWAATRLGSGKKASESA